MKAAVLGATGFVGRALVPALETRAEVVAVSRRGPVAADVTSEADVRRVLEGVDVVYYLVHSLGSGDFTAVDRRAAETVARESARAGVDQIVFLGGLGDDAPDLSPHLRSRAETARVLADGDVPVTTLRAAVVVGRGSAGFETIVALVDRLPVMVAPKWIAMPTQPIAIEDVVGYLVDVAGAEPASGESFDVGGPEVLTYREMLERVARLRGRHPRIVEVPLLSPRLSSYWLHLVTPVRANVSRPLVEGLRNPTVARDERIRELFPRALRPFDEAAEEALRAPNPEPLP